MAEQKAIQSTPPPAVQKMPGQEAPSGSAKPIPANPVPTQPQPKRSFLKNPFFYFATFILLLFAGGYYFIYSTLENEVGKLVSKVKSPTPLPLLSPTENEAPYIENAKQNLAAKLHIPATQITVVSAQKTTWSDGSMGCPQPGMMYTQSLVGGYQVILEINGKRYDYHSGLDPQTIFLCEK